MQITVSHVAGNNLKMMMSMINKFKLSVPDIYITIPAAIVHIQKISSQFQFVCFVKTKQLYRFSISLYNYLKLKCSLCPDALGTFVKFIDKTQNLVSL